MDEVWRRCGRVVELSLPVRRWGCGGCVKVKKKKKSGGNNLSVSELFPGVAQLFVSAVARRRGDPHTLPVCPRVKVEETAAPKS